MMEYSKHLLFGISLILIAIKSRNNYYRHLQFNDRVAQAFAEARRLYRTDPNEIFEPQWMRQSDDDEDNDDEDDDDDDDGLF